MAWSPHMCTGKGASHLQTHTAVVSGALHPNGSTIRTALLPNDPCPTVLVKGNKPLQLFGLFKESSKKGNIR